MHQLGVAVDLGAGEAGGEGLVGIALDAHDPPSSTVGEERAHVGAIVRADDADRFHERSEAISSLKRVAVEIATGSLVADATSL